MMYIGTSLGGCLQSILANEVSEDDVMFIVTRTMAPDFDRYIKVVNAYYAQGNPYARKSSMYELSDYDLDNVTDLATRLWNAGKIHQPRVIVEESLGQSYSHPIKFEHGLWMQVVPTNQNSNPAVVEAWEKYKMLDMLTR